MTLISPARLALAVMAAALFAPAAQGDTVLYVANLNGTTVSTIPAGGGAATLFASGFIAPFSIAFDAAGDLFVSNSDGTTVSEVVKGTTTPVTFATGLSGPTGLAFDSAGNL